MTLLIESRRVQYQSSHSCTCIDDAAPDEKHECELQARDWPEIRRDTPRYAEIRRDTPRVAESRPR